MKMVVEHALTAHGWFRDCTDLTQIITNALHGTVTGIGRWVQQICKGATYERHHMRALQLYSGRRGG